MFITNLSAYLDKADVNITFSKKGDVITAIIVPKPKEDKISELSPIVISGTAEELDANLITSLTTVFEKINAFKVVGVEEVEKQIDDASKEPVKKAPVKKAVKKDTSKADAKKAFEAGKKLFDAAKYKDALVEYDKAISLDKTNKGYAAAQKLCKQWVDRLAEASLFPEEEQPQVKGAGNAAATTTVTVENPPTEPEVMATEEELNQDQIGDPEVEDDDDFSI